MIQGYGKRAIIFTIIVLSLVGNAVLGGYLIWLNLQREESTVVSLDMVMRPVDYLSDLANGTVWVAAHEYIMTPTLENEMANNNEKNPLDQGNIYAPDILYENGIYRMWYGGQSSTGHDSILYATSVDGVHWEKYGTVIPTGVNNHVNDPSVVKVNGTFYMYFSVAPTAELDQIWCATSQNGVNWTVYGAVLIADPDAARWDSLKVGRPSVLYQNNTFKMWFDGSQRDVLNPTKIAPYSGRHVGYAYSNDGFTWTKWNSNPIFNHSGAIDVKYLDNQYIVVEEGGDGIRWRIGINETSWEQSYRQLFSKMGTDFDAYGHVTPFILIKDNQWVATYTGAATVKSWDRNRIDVWYPMHNMTLSIANEVLRPWAGTSNRMFWELPIDDQTTTYTLTDTFSPGQTASITREIEPRMTHQYLYSENSLICIN